MKEFDEIDELFGSAFSDFEKVPPPEVKAAIDEQLFSGSGPVNRRRKIGWIYGVMGTVILFLFLLVKCLPGEEGAQHGVVKENITSQAGSNDDGRSEIHKDRSDQTDRSTANSGGENNETVSGLTKSTSTTADESSKKAQKSNFLKKPAKQGTIRTSKRRSSKSESSDLTRMNNGTGSPDAGNQNADASSQSDPFVADEENITGNSDVAPVSEEEIKKDPEIINEVAEVIDSVPPVEQKADPDAVIVPQDSPAKWSLTVLLGTTQGLSVLEQNTVQYYHARESFGASIGFETGYALTSRIGITSGLGYSFRRDRLYYEATDSTLTGEHYNYIYDPQIVDSVIDSVLVSDYEHFTTNKDQVISHSEISIPILMNVLLYEGNKVSYHLQGGLRASYVMAKLYSNEFDLPEPEIRSFGLRVMVRPEVVYKMNKIRLGAYINAGYDLLPVNKWSFVQGNVQQKRIDLGVGFLMRFEL